MYSHFVASCVYKLVDTVILMMGGAVSSGASNNELVDNLCSEGYITRSDVEKVFRVVDRADYMTFSEEEDRLEAYEDHAWRKGSVHISAPCIYTKAMEALELKEGASFLNIGSGTGYLSTMAGLLLGPTGVNHGVEILPDNVEYATDKLSGFKEQSQWYDPLTFCDPTFLVGNGLLMAPGHMQYDSVYCGAACPTEHIDLVKGLLKVGGILVCPVDNKLESYSRVGENEWKCKVILPSVSFASLAVPSEDDLKRLSLVEFKVEPESLKQLCRLTVLKHVSRPKYPFLASLPLPQHLKDYVSHYRHWNPPPSPLPLYCDKPSTKDRDRTQESSSANAHQAMPNTVFVNGRRVLLCSFNGVVFQIPIESEEEEEEGEGASDAAEHGAELDVEASSDMETSHSDTEDH